MGDVVPAGMAAALEAVHANRVTPDRLRLERVAHRRALVDHSIRVALLASAGESFTAGNDLTDFAATALGGEAPAASGFIEAIAQFSKPLVAAVPGLAIGVGTAMLLHCDLVFVANDAKLTTPFTNLALVPEAASSLLLPARIGHVRAFAMFPLGEGFTGTEAVQLGLANVAVPAPEVIQQGLTGPAAPAQTRRAPLPRST